MEYRVEVYDRRGCWVRSSRSALTDKRWSTLSDALHSLVAHGSTSTKYRIIDEYLNVPFEGRVQAARTLLDNPTKEMNMDYVSDLPVLNVDREKFIEALQPKLDAEVAEREANEAAVTAKEAELAAACEELSNEELVTLVKKYWTSNPDDVKVAIKNRTFVPKGSTPTQSETDLARAVRVLGLSTDKTIELKPGTNLYQLI